MNIPRELRILGLVAAAIILVRFLVTALDSVAEAVERKGLYE
jgi:hypothetical protein